MLKAEGHKKYLFDDVVEATGSWCDDFQKTERMFLKVGAFFVLTKLVSYFRLYVQNKYMLV